MTLEKERISVMAIIFDGKRIAKIACAVLALTRHLPSHGTITSDSRNDPYPVYTSLDPQTYLYTHDRQVLKGLIPIRDKPERFSLSISPYTQGANKARIKKTNAGPTPTPVDDLCTLPDPCNEVCVEIGDLDGQWAMIALLFGKTPQGRQLPPALLEARTALFPDVPLGTPITDALAIAAEPTDDATTKTRCGFFSVPVCYRKRGIRFELETLLACDVGLKLSTGLANIYQAPSQFRNLTALMTTTETSCDPLNPNLTPTNIDEFLMQPCKFKVITDQIDLNICPFEEFSVEDIRGAVYWRHAYLFNEGKKSWAQFLLLPFVEIGGSIPAGKPRDPRKAFALSFGSNDHYSVGITAGLNIDFTETIEIGAEAGITHFFARDICNFRVPNSRCQSGIYPFATDVNIQPGNNEFFGAKMSAYHFLDRLSFYLEYILVKHHHDKICLKTPDDAFRPDILECRSAWVSQSFDAAMTYDIAPNIALGVLWQAPFKEDGTYRSTTLLFTFNVTF